MAKVYKIPSRFHRGDRVGLEAPLERNSRLDPSSAVLARRLLRKTTNSMRPRVQTVPALRIRVSKASNKGLVDAREASPVLAWDLDPSSSSNKARANRLREDTSLIGTHNRLKQRDLMVIPTRPITGNILNTGSKRVLRY